MTVCNSTRMNVNFRMTYTEYSAIETFYNFFNDNDIPIDEMITVMDEWLSHGEDTVSTDSGDYYFNIDYPEKRP